MKANRQARNERNDRAEVGIGTMIVFIAAVIVAAIAAAVLVNTAGNLQRKSQETGQETTQEVSANIFVRDIIGHNEDTDDNLEHVMWYVSLAPGADPVDLNETVLRYKAEENATTLTQDVGDNDCATDANQPGLGSGFCVEYVEQASGDGNRFLLSPGDLVKVHVRLQDGVAGDEQDIDPRTEVNALFMPEEGSPTDASFSTPSSLGGDTYKSLA